MAFYSGDKEFSDKEVANAYKQRLAERKEWCLKQAQQLFAAKCPTHRYTMDLFYPEIDYQMNIVLRGAELQEYQDFVTKCRREFEADCPEDIHDEEAWQDYLSDAWLEADLTIDTIDPLGYEVTAEVRGVDLDNPINTYLFKIASVDPDHPEQTSLHNCWIDLTDDQYTRLLAACLYDENLNVGALYSLHPDIFQTLAKSYIGQGSDCVLFLHEVKEDAQRILSTVGEERPSLPEGPFADIAAWLASKEEA